MLNSDVIGGKIIPLFLNRRVMKDCITQEVLSYWESLRQGRLVPKRSEIDPRKLPRALNYTFILEARTPDNIRLRLTGSKLCDCMGMEMRGMPAYAMFEHGERNKFNEALQSALAHPEILDLQLAPTARMVLLPMADEDNTVSRILGCISVDANHPSFPARFRILSTTRTRIIAAKPITAKLVAKMAEDQKIFAPKPKKAASGKPPFLRIVK